LEVDREEKILLKEYEKKVSDRHRFIEARRLTQE
jgi:hypothetical protein